VAARALLEAQITRVWQNPAIGSEGRDPGTEELQAAIWSTSACIRIAEAALNSPAAGLCTRVRRCNEGCGIFASRPNTWRSSRHYVTAGAAVPARLSSEQTVPLSWCGTGLKE
jgi:hypothetical protein